VSQTVSLAKDVQPIFQHHCAGVEGCHFAVRTPVGSYKFFVNAKSRECQDGRMLILPGDVSHSYVVDKITDQNLCQGSPMPKYLAAGHWQQLPQADVQTIYDWICEGAPNN
jgi:hypothetical protein